MAVHKMLLYPVALDGPPVQADSAIEELRRIGLIGRQLRSASDAIYLAGERFLQLITFLGCSPAIELGPPDDRNTSNPDSQRSDFCHVRFSGNGHDIRFRASMQVSTPRCLSCRQAEEHWQTLIDQWKTSPDRDQWQCRRCGYSGSLYELNFRKTAGFGRFFVEIWHIYPAEAVAGEALLYALKGITGCAWNTLYVSE